MHSVVTLYCPNLTCQAGNSEHNRFCQTCSRPLAHRYLWALGEESLVYQPGELVADRYLCKQPRIFLDTKPGQLSNTYQELPEPFLPYLRLAGYALHIPQLYDWAPVDPVELVLLDQGPLGWMNATGQVVNPETVTPTSDSAFQFYPTLLAKWQQATPPRQLNWLWQIANLWQPFSSEQVAGSLIDPELVRVEGSIVRLQELQLQTPQPTLADLGQVWQQWADIAHPEVKELITNVAQGLIAGQIYNAELLTAYLDEGLKQLAQAQTRQIQIATLSDQGPTRQRNEDACYPISGTQTPVLSDEGLLIVCDGIGGHQGGDVASHLAITTLEQRLNTLNLNQLDATTLVIELENATCAANDEISQRNDQENRFERQRMGTTVVMALARGHELYITHIGDSRAYWITRHGCHQITLDDDVASREVRLGYSFYRQALHQPSAGSLVQALGMSPSNLLYPNVQRLIPDEDSIFLLCSDGLSDNDRVEEIWASEILPLLEGKTDLISVSQKLIDVANSRNGYDNATVGLIHYRVAITHPLPVLTDLPTLPGSMAAAAPPTAEFMSSPTLLPTEVVAPADDLAGPLEASPEPSAKARWLPWVLGAGLLMAVLGVLTALRPSLRSPAPMVSTPELPSPSPVPTQTQVPALAQLEVGTIVQLSQALAGNNSSQPAVLLNRPPSASPEPTPTNPEVIGQLPVGTVLEVIRKQNLSQQESWVELRVCSTIAGESPEQGTPAPDVPIRSPSPVAAPDPALIVAEVGQTGWMREVDLLPRVTPQVNLPPEQLQSCQ